ncbi:hypothetical protein BG015_003772 [Linnemannia schmuckeri]|uniref:Uncharacterized protein n=1 Tax=Linnemannia schmuckeri TaxID=64567 RepID=A0A9P5S2Z3_9FUNG|nr:hypothetical protein BG015_003772 [Linnemannia schmuckeri]
MTVTSSAFLDFVIGFVVSLIASVMNAAGLNLLKLDHVRNSARTQERQRHECGRPMWHLGLYLYVGSQLAGSTIALNFLKTQWVAPLGSIALIFNFVFAKILVGTRITKKDVYGTIVVMISVVWVVIFGGINSAGADIEDSLTIFELKELFSRLVFIFYFSILNIMIGALLSLGLYAYWAITLDDESGQMRKRMKTKLTQLLGTNRFARASGLTLVGDSGLDADVKDVRLKKVVAMIMATCGGLIASQTLLLAKSGIKLITSSISGQNQFKDSLSYFILFVLVLTAVLQVYCLNTALKLYDSVLVVPMFYGFYTAFGLINSIIYLNQLQNYKPWVLFLILVGIGTLIYGVRMLSAPKPELESADDSEQSDDQDGEGRAAGRRRSQGNDADMHGYGIGHRRKFGSSGSVSGAGASGQGGASGGNGGSNEKLSDNPSRHGSLTRKQDSEGKILTGAQDGEEYEGVDALPSILSGNNRRRRCGPDVTADNVGTTTTRRGTGTDSVLSCSSDSFRSPRDERSMADLDVAAEAAAAALTAGVMAGARATAVANAAAAGGSDPDKQLLPMAPAHLDKRLGNIDRGRAGRGSIDERRRSSLPRIDTGSGLVTRGRSETRRGPTSASLTHVPERVPSTVYQLALPYQAQASADGALGLGGSKSPSPTSAAPMDRDGGQPSSPRWATVIEDLKNPFKAFRRSSVDSSMPRSESPQRRVPFLGGGGEIGSGSEAWRKHRERHGSWTGLPSEWEEPKRKMMHSMLFGKNGRSSSVGSWKSSRGSSPAPPRDEMYYSPVHLRRQSMAEMGSGIWAAGSSGSSHRRAGGPLDSMPPVDDGSNSEPQGYQKHYFTGTPPPLSATVGGGPGGYSQSSIPNTSTTSSYGHGHQGRQLSFTTKSEYGIPLSLAGSKLDLGSFNGLLLSKSALGSSSTGTFGGKHSSGDGESYSASGGSDGGGSSPGSGSRLSACVQQLQHLQQHQHHPTSQLQHSMTTSSLSTIGSGRIPSSFPTSTSLVQLPAADADAAQMRLSSDGSDPSTVGMSDSYTSSNSVAGFLWKGMTPSQTMQAVELDMETLDREVEEWTVDTSNPMTTTTSITISPVS